MLGGWKGWDIQGYETELSWGCCLMVFIVELYNRDNTCIILQEGEFLHS